VANPNPNPKSSKEGPKDATTEEHTRKKPEKLKEEDIKILKNIILNTFIYQ